MLPVTFVYTKTEELRVYVVLHEILTLEVNHRTGVACLIENEE